MTIKNELLKILNTKAGRYKGLDVNILGLPVFQNKNPKSVKNAFYSLYREGLLDIKDKNLILTKKGRSFIKKKVLENNIFNFSFTKNSPKNLLVMYDIPEDRKSEREWFRRHLIKFEYTMIQLSVWVGPSPLPKDFLNYVKKIGLMDNLKMFKLSSDYINKQN